MLCIKDSYLKKISGIKKDLDMQTVLEEKCWHFNSKEEATKSHYTPISLRVIFRTAYTNKVLQDNSGPLSFYSLYKADLEKLVHRGLDYIMFQASVLIMSTFSVYTVDVDKSMAYSAFLPIGIINDPDSWNPCLLVQVVLKDDTLAPLEAMLKDQFKFVDIDSISKTNELESVLKEIIKVKEEVLDGAV